MIYYLFLAIVDIGLFLSDNWKELTGTAIASGVGIILGKRLGVRLAVNQFTKLFGLEKKSTLEQQVMWLLELERGRGNIWSAEQRTSKHNIIGRLYPSRWVTTFRVLSAKSFIHRTETHQLTLRRKKSMNKFKSRKFWMSVISAILVISNEGLGLGISPETVTTFAALIASFIFSEAYIDGKRAKEDVNIGDSGPAE